MWSHNDNNKARISEPEYGAVREFLLQSSGIVLGDNKQYLVQSRLYPLLRRFELASFTDLISALQSSLPVSHKLRVAVVDAMTTNETFWFRDKMHFDVMQQTLFPDLLKQKTGTLRVWSAACSSGQEPYSISISAIEALKSFGRGRQIQIIGTDISETVLLEAKQGVYSELALSRGMTLADRERYFVKVHEGFKLKTEYSQQVRFQQFNLLKPFSVLGRFDVIFCRNVLIYFSEDIKRDILRRMAAALEPGGYLFLSSTEAMPSDVNDFVPVKGSVRYFKKVS